MNDPRDVTHRRPPPPPPPKRKIFQLVAAGGGENRDPSLYALCNDGTAWELNNGSWWQLPEIPQP